MALSVLLIASSAFTLSPSLQRSGLSARMSVTDACVSVASGPLGDTYACDEPQGLGSELELLGGQMKWTRHPSMPTATIVDMDGACVQIGTEGTKMIWACKVNCPLHTATELAELPQCAKASAQVVACGNVVPYVARCPLHRGRAQQTASTASSSLSMASSSGNALSEEARRWKESQGQSKSSALRPNRA